MHASRRARRRSVKRQLPSAATSSQAAPPEPASPGETVHAIFDFGDGYAIYVPGGHEVVTKRQTYAVVEFDA